MDCIDLFKKAAAAMQTDPRYLELDAARRENDNDQELQGLIGEFNLKRLDLNNESAKPEPDTAHVAELNQQVNDLYTQIIKDYINSEYTGTKDMVMKTMAGINLQELPQQHTNLLVDMVSDRTKLVCAPMPNLYFTRDPGACVGEGINIHRMHTPARKRESLLLKYMFLYNRDFATQDNKMWYDLSDSYSIEGGDVLVLSKDIVAVGLSERTTVSGAETFARNLLQNSDFKKVLAFDIPETRAFMHLDTVFTMVDYDKFTIHPEIEGPLSVYEMTLDEHGELRFGAIKEELKDILALELKLPAVDLIRCGGGDLMAAQREQWNDGSNTLCIAPGRVITYERNYVTNDLLAKHGLDVLTVPSAELSRGRGGPRCRSCPVNRDDL